ncbi:ABC transporter permease [Pleomorphomonas sp. JP5]|uniref:ABC transporter permease n=1 Tax=Pleomorphomonas sp. JP5 TaxID=2942998 RepID=UPI0020439F92|nr:ABC transporter permease [Pleomorphomonas sp. JP5]MCM5558092.1 ABC transporter permease [Pleomorphomonas sp. JP5]
MLSRYVFRHETILALLLVLALALSANLSDRFFTVDNLLNQGRMLTEVGIIAIAMTFVIITGGIDLSVGSILGLSAITLGVVWKTLGVPLPLAMVVAVLAGAVCGAVNGVIIIKSRMPPMIATLGTLALYRGLAEGISQARSVRGYPEWFFVLGQGEFFGVPTQLWVFGLLVVVAAIILGYMTFGRVTYAVGANETAARFSGMNVDRAKLLIYTASGSMAALAAVIFVSRVSTTRSDMGMGIEMDAISAVVLGGTSIFGGRGTMIGTLLGILLIQTMKNGLTLAGVKGDGTIIVIGSILILTILISNLVNRKRD